MTTSAYRSLVLGVGILGTACAASTPRDTVPHAYVCDGNDVVVSMDAARASGMTAPIAYRGDSADRYVDGATELSVPHDRLADAVIVRNGARTTCMARGGYTDVISRYLRSESTHEVAMQLQLDDDDVRGRILAGWHRLGAKYRRDR